MGGVLVAGRLDWSRTNRRNAVRRAGRDAAGPPIPLPAQRTAVRMVSEALIVMALIGGRRLGWMVGEDVVEPGQPGAEALF